jgi:hypothetical protein
MNGKQYLEHMAGIANLLEWIIVNEKLGYDFHYEDDRVILNEQITSRFLIGVPKSKKFGRHPFIATQKREAVFLRLLNITRLIVRQGDYHLHLVVSGVKGDGETYPDLPPFVVSLAFDHPEKSDIISQAQSIDCRGFWIDENDSIEIGSKAILWNKPLLMLPAGAPLLDKFDETDGPTFSDIIRMKIESTNVAQDPGFVRG